jgi:hypothetical protein
MIRNQDIIDRMERNGEYVSAIEFKNSLHEHGHNEDDFADRFNPADGSQYSRAGYVAEEAYKDIRRDERRKEERQQEEDEMRLHEFS